LIIVVRYSCHLHWFFQGFDHIIDHFSLLNVLDSSIWYWWATYILVLFLLFVMRIYWVKMHGVKSTYYLIYLLEFHKDEISNLFLLILKVSFLLMMSIWNIVFSLYLYNIWYPKLHESTSFSGYWIWFILNIE